MGELGLFFQVSGAGGSEKEWRRGENKAALHFAPIGCAQGRTTTTVGGEERRTEVRPYMEQRRSCDLAQDDKRREGHHKEPASQKAAATSYTGLKTGHYRS